MYEWRSDAWAGCLEHQLHQTEQLRELAHNSVERHAPVLAKPQQHRLQKMITYYNFMVANLTSLLQDYRGQL